MGYADVIDGLSVDLLPDIACVERQQWQELLARGDTNVVYLTREWLLTWWDVYRRGQLLIPAVRKDNEIVAFTPLFAEDGMVYFVGSGHGSDYMDFIGDISNPNVLDALLTTARGHVDDFIGFRFYFIPERSRTGEFLRQAAKRLNLEFDDEGEMPAPVLNFDRSGAGEAAVNKKSLRRHERFFERAGELEAREWRRSNDILPHLDEFFEQHVARWQSTPSPSRFLKEKHREFYRRLTRAASDAGWLRFTRIEWQSRAIAMHFGFCYNDSFLWYKPTFAIDLARHSPGEVLLRRLLVAAINEGASAFDFGIGGEAFKHRFATATPVVRTWGLYAPGRRGERDRE